jgi:mannose-1-phosphate guanylyltransferase/mannose-6-phosphate isomerase
MNESDLPVYPILLAGGTGTRLWPVSRELYPKQLVKFIGRDSFVQSTIKRLTPVLNLQNVRVVCGRTHYHEIARHMADIGIAAEGKIIQEPSGRNTAPAILLAAFHLRRIVPNAILCVLPADHVIADIESFHRALRAAINLADKDYIVTFGIKPHYPETGYGYIEGGTAVSEDAFSAKRFVEKPNRKTAEKYIQAGNFYWNSGMFAFKCAVILEEFKAHQPQLLATMEEIFSTRHPLEKEAYDRLDDISIDYAIMEKTDKCVVVPSDFGWSDIGSWKALYDFLEKDAHQNVIDGDVIAQNTRNCFIMGHERLIATNCLRNMVVVETPDSIFVSDLEHSRDVKSIVSRLKDEGRKEFYQHRLVHHPWGIARLLEHHDNYTATELTVYPGCSLEMPAQTNTAYHLFVIRGQGSFVTALEDKTLRSGEAITCSEDKQVCIRNGAKIVLSVIQVALKHQADD